MCIYCTLIYMGGRRDDENQVWARESSPFASRSVVDLVDSVICSLAFAHPPPSLVIMTRFHTNLAHANVARKGHDHLPSPYPVRHKFSAGLGVRAYVGGVVTLPNWADSSLSCPRA